DGEARCWVEASAPHILEALDVGSVPENLFQAGVHEGLDQRQCDNQRSYNRNPPQKRAEPKSKRHRDHQKHPKRTVGLGAFYDSQEPSSSKTADGDDQQQNPVGRHSQQMREFGNDEVTVRVKYRVHDHWQQNWESKEQFRAHGLVPNHSTVPANPLPYRFSAVTRQCAPLTRATIPPDASLKYVLSSSARPSHLSVSDHRWGEIVQAAHVQYRNAILHQ